MSLKVVMSLEQAKQHAESLIRTFSPFCERIEIAGSIRRQKFEIGDIELVVIPKIEAKKNQGLGAFLNIDTKPKKVNQLEKAIVTMIQHDDCKLKKNGPKYKELIYPGLYKLDLFIANHDNFGVIYMIRTGSAVYSKMFMTEINKIGKYRIKDGFLWLRNGSQGFPQKIPVKTEKDLFKIVGFPYKDPEERIQSIY